NQNRAEHEIMSHGVDDFVDELAAIVHSLQLHILRQGMADRLDLRGDAAGDIVAVLPHEHEDEPQHRFALPIRRDRPPSNLVTHLNLSDIAHASRYAVMTGHDDVTDRLEAGKLSDA